MNYTGKKQFKVTNNWDDDMNCVIEIDFNHPDVVDKIKNMVEFWSGWEDLLYDNDEDYVKAFLKMTGADIQRVALERDYNTQGVRSAYDDREGWYKMDGTDGITILQHSTIEWDEDDFEIEETSGVKKFEVNLFA